MSQPPAAPSPPPAASRVEVCIVACAEAFLGDRDLLCNPIGNVPVIGGRLARATFAPELVYTDTVAALVAGNHPVGPVSSSGPASSDGPATPNGRKIIESYAPYRSVFDIVWSGRRHVLMGASQIDMWGNQNIAAIGGWDKPKAQLLGLRGAPGNLVNHTTSYWVPQHSTRSFVAQVDVVSGPGYDRMRELGAPGNRFHEVRRVVSNLGVFDFDTPDRRMRIRSLHPGVELSEVTENTGFDLATDQTQAEPATTRLPTDEELRLIREVLDPANLRDRELPA